MVVELDNPDSSVSLNDLIDKNTWLPPKTREFIKDAHDKKMLEPVTKIRSRQQKAQSELSRVVRNAVTSQEDDIAAEDLVRAIWLIDFLNPLEINTRRDLINEMAGAHPQLEDRLLSIQEEVRTELTVI